VVTGIKSHDDDDRHNILSSTLRDGYDITKPETSQRGKTDTRRSYDLASYTLHRSRAVAPVRNSADRETFTQLWPRIMYTTAAIISYSSDNYQTNNNFAILLNKQYELSLQHKWLHNQ
jgi:hypothetical protein